MSLLNALMKILSGTENCCCLCFENIEGCAVYKDDEVNIDGFQNTITMSTVLDHIFAKTVTNIPMSIGVICKQCKISALNSYQFMRQSEINSEKLAKAIECLTETFSNTIQDYRRYKSMYVVINTDDFTTYQYYDDNENIEHSSKVEKNISEAETKSFVMPSSDKTLVKSKKKEIDICGDYDIPSVPNSEITLDVNENHLKCSVCYKSFTEIQRLRKHFFRFHYPRNEKCSKCSQCFISKKLLKIHFDKYHSDVACSICGKRFTNKYFLLKHEMNHNFRIVCQDCGRVYRSKEAFKKHITDEVCKQKMRKSCNEGNYLCDYCNKGYCYKPYLAKHIMHEHLNAKGYQCRYCNKTLYTPSALKVHTYKHTQEKTFECELCSGKFVTKTSLLYHTRLHTGEKPYKCEFCDAAFLSASRRLDHTRRHHLEPSLECDICHSKFKATGSLLKHKKRHLNPNNRLPINAEATVAK